MVAFDVMPMTSEHGGHSRIEAYERAAVPTYRIGEWVIIGATGVIQEQAEAAGGANYIPATNRLAAEDGLLSIARIGDARYVDPPNTAKLDSVYALLNDVEFHTRNAFNGTDANIGPAGAFAAATVIPGDTCGIHVTAVPTTVLAIHGIDMGDTGLVVTRLLDAQGTDTALSGAAVDRIVFKALL